MTEEAGQTPESDRPAGASSGRLSAIILSAQLSERFLALVLAAVVAAWLGAGRTLDIGLLALAVPNAVGDLLETILYVGLLPLFSRQWTVEGEAAAWRLANRTINTAVLGMLGLLALYLALVPLTTRLMAQSYPPADLRRAISLGLIAGPIILFRGLGGTAAAFLMTRYAVWPAFGRFGVRGVVRVLIFVALYRMGWGVTAFVISTPLGDLAALLPCLLAARRFTGGERYRVRVLLPGSTLAGILSQVGNQGIIGGVNAAVLILERSFASGLAAGSVAILNYTRGLALLPLMSGRSISTAFYPRLARQAAAQDPDLGPTVWRGLRAAALATIPLCVAFFVVREPLVAVFYRRGAFTQHDMQRVAALMPYYLGGCVLWSLSFMASRALFAVMQSALVAKLEFLSWFVYLASVVYLTPRLGIAGIGLAFLLRIIVSSGLVLVAARRRGVVSPKRPGRYTAHTVIGAVVLAAGAWVGYRAASASSSARRCALRYACFTLPPSNIAAFPESVRERQSWDWSVAPLQGATI